MTSRLHRPAPARWSPVPSRRPEPSHGYRHHPAEFGKLRLVSVEHVEAWLMILEFKFEDAALCLTLHDGIDRLARRREGRTVIVIVEKVGVQVDRIQGR